MVRCLSVLITLAAQFSLLLSPVCLVRCSGRDGNHRLELVGQDCHCRATAPQLPTSHEGEQSSPEALATCCRQGLDHDHQMQPSGIAERCGCEHSPVGLSPQVASKSVKVDVALHTAACHTAGVVWTNDALASGEQSDVWKRLPRLTAPLHLLALKSVVLRV